MFTTFVVRISPLAFKDHGRLNAHLPAILRPRSKRVAHRALRGQDLRPRLKLWVAPDKLGGLHAVAYLRDVDDGRVATNGCSGIQNRHEKVVDVETFDNYFLSDVKKKGSENGGDERRGREREHIAEAMTVVNFNSHATQVQN
jgi:hypothetical protein